MTTIREGFQCELKQTLQKLKTYPGITSTLLTALQAYSRDTEVSLDVTDFRGPIDNMVLLAIDEQDKIDWDGLHHSLLSTKWAAAQQRRTLKFLVPERKTLGKRGSACLS